MTQRDLAGRLKVKASYIAYLEGNERRPSIEFLVKLVKALNLDGRQMFLLAYPGAKSLIQRR
jgi:transcriptional regulator with XRE-family HTH domain